MTLSRKIAVVVVSLLSISCSSSGDGAGGFGNGVSLLFDGVDDYGSAGDISDTLSTEVDSLSISLWFKSEGVPIAESVMLQLNPELETGMNSMQITLYWETSTQIGLHLTPDFAAEPGAMLFVDVEESEEWNHVAVTFDSGANSEHVRIYLNGVEAGSASQGSPLTAVGNIQFARQGEGVNYYNGYLDEAAIWDEPLGSEEVASLYNRGKPRDIRVDYGNYASSMALRSLWRMGDENDPEEPNVSDLISENHFTIVGGGVFQQDAP